MTAESKRAQGHVYSCSITANGPNSAQLVFNLREAGGTMPAYVSGAGTEPRALFAMTAILQAAMVLNEKVDVTYYDGDPRTVAVVGIPASSYPMK